MNLLRRAFAFPRLPVKPPAISCRSLGLERLARINSTPSTPALSSRLVSSVFQKERLSTFSHLRKSSVRSLQAQFFSTNTSNPNDSPLPVLSPPIVGRWLLFSSTLVFAVIVVGGVTRLTESGLSITEWRPITGVLPPISPADWEGEFEKYKATPEFKLCV